MKSSLDLLHPFATKTAYSVFEKATNYSLKLCKDAESIVAKFLRENDFDETTLCIICIGSVGRLEALEASDIDIVPVLKNSEALEKYDLIDMALRKKLSNDLGVKVSKGENLTKSIALEDLVDPKSIGGEKDGSALLTKRILLLTEGRAIGGGYSFEEILQSIFESYADAEKTSGRYALSFCNDLSRYYRTLFIEYKAKIDSEEKDWCLRNLKLRHSRKFWFFSTVLSVIKHANDHPEGGEQFKKELLHLLQEPPYARLCHSVNLTHRHSISRILDRFSDFLNYISQAEGRKALEEIKHGERYLSGINPFQTFKYNSSLMHGEMFLLVEGLDPYVKRRIFDWFFL